MATQDQLYITIEKMSEYTSKQVRQELKEIAKETNLTSLYRIKQPSIGNLLLFILLNKESFIHWVLSIKKHKRFGNWYQELLIKEIFEK